MRDFTPVVPSEFVTTQGEHEPLEIMNKGHICIQGSIEVNTGKHKLHVRDLFFSETNYCFAPTNTEVQSAIQPWTGESIINKQFQHKNLLRGYFLFSNKNSYCQKFIGLTIKISVPLLFGRVCRLIRGCDSTLQISIL